MLISTTPCEPRNTKIHRSVTIQAVFASHIQREVALRTLDKILAAWKGTVENSHKKNKITITHRKEPITTS
jgi:ABC-type Fe3+/spermidine/putrescine transport system ATPase subunit